MKYSRKGGELQPTHPNVNSEVSQVPLASQARHRGTWLPPRWHWGWNCTRCTLQTSSPPPRKLGSGELVCKVHLVQFQLKYTRVHVRVHLSSQARISELEHELRCTWVGEVLHLFRRTSSKVLCINWKTTLWLYFSWKNVCVKTNQPWYTLGKCQLIKLCQQKVQKWLEKNTILIVN